MIALPSRLFHATWPTRLTAILAEGIRGGDIGEVYLAGRPEHAAGFLRMRGGEYLGYKTVTVTIDGQAADFLLPNIVQHDRIIVIEIDTEHLDPTLVTQSSDHAAFYTPDDLVAYVHNGNIPAATIVQHHTYSHA